MPDSLFKIRLGLFSLLIGLALMHLLLVCLQNSLVDDNNRAMMSTNRSLWLSPRNGSLSKKTERKEPTTATTTSKNARSNISSHPVKPTFIIHAGPPKTATSFLQCSLCAKTVDLILKQDNFVYLGTCPYQTCGMGRLPSQFLGHQISSFFVRYQTTLQPHFEKFVNASIGKNVILVFEGFHAIDETRIQVLSKLLQPHWHVHIVIGYRPFAQWLPSKYNSVVKPARNWRAVKWPPKGDVIQPFDPSSNLTRAETKSDVLFVNKQHVVERMRNAYAPYVDTVTLLSLHPWNASPVPEGVDATLHAFLCHIIDNAPHTCQAVLEKRIGSHVSNPSEPLEYDILATAAWAAHRINGDTHSRKEIRKLMEHAELPFQWKCLPNSTVDEFEALSWHMEQRLFPHDDGENENRHHAGFAYLRDSKRTFCTVDTEKTLQDPSWTRFFDDLKRQ